MKGESVLVVGCSEYVVATIQNILREEGYHADVVMSGGQALEQAMNSKYHMVIMNMKLPDISGVEVAHRMRILDDKTRLILLADDSTFNDCIDLLDSGVEEILIKPVESNELTRVIGEALRS